MGNRTDKESADNCEDELLQIKERLEAETEAISLDDYLIKIMEASSGKTKKCEVLEVLVSKVKRENFVTFLNIPIPKLICDERISASEHSDVLEEQSSASTTKEVKSRRKSNEDSQGSAFLVKALTYYVANEKYRSNDNNIDDFLQYITKLIELGADYRGLLTLKELYDNTKVLNTSENNNDELDCFNIACSKLKRNIKQSRELEEGKRDQFKVFIEGVISNDNPLLITVLRQDKKVFNTFLKKGYPINQYYNGNNLLHSIVLLPGERKVESLEFILANVEKKEDIREAVKAKNSEGLTPLQVLLSAKIKAGESVFKSFTSHNYSNNNTSRCAVILLAKCGANVDDLEFNVDEREKEIYHGLLKQLKNSVEEYIQSGTLEIDVKELEALKRDIVMKGEYIIDGGRLALHTAVLERDKEKLRNFVQKGYDPSTQDENGNNILHIIASMPGKKRAKYLEIILSAIDKSGNESLLKKAINGKNKCELTPIQVALHRKIEQIEDDEGKFIKALNPYPNHYTSNFCIKLLQNGANKEQLTLSGTSVHSKKYYDVITQVESKMGSGITKDAMNKLNGQFSKVKKWKEMTVIGGLVGFAILSTLLGDIATKVMLLCVIAVCITCYLIYCKLASFSIFKHSGMPFNPPDDMPLKVITDPNVSRGGNDQGISR